MNIKNFIILFLFIFALNSTFSQVNVVAASLTTSGDPFPEVGMCPASGRTLQVKVVNTGTVNLNVVSTPVTISINITGPVNQSFSTVLNSGNQIIPGGSRYVNVTTSGDFSLKGEYSVAMSATCAGDASPGIDITEILTIEGNKLSLTSAPATTAQTVCLNSTISPITYELSGNSTSATVNGLPAGVTAVINFPTLTITGSPSTLAGSPFSYSVTSTGGCPSSENETLNGSMIVKALPVISIVDKSNDTLTCNDPLFIYNAMGGTTYSWSTGASTSNITVSTPGKYILTGTANGCSNKDSIDVKQNITPPISPVGTDVSRCGPGTVNLSVTTVPNTTVTWYASNQSTIVASGLNYTTPSISSTTSYFVEAKNNSTGCLSTKREVKGIIIPFNSSSASSSSSINCINVALTPITHTTTGATGIGTVTGLPSGVIASFNPATGIITISGTPTTTVGSPFSYSIPLTGGCGTVSATGTITVNSSNTVTGPGNAIVCVNSALTPISHITTGATGIASTTTNYGLPSGLTASFNAGTGAITIGGTPTVSGIFNYSIPLTGGCGTENATGTITVNPKPTISPITGKSNFCVGETATLSSSTVGGEWSSSSSTIASIDKDNGLLIAAKSGITDIYYTVAINGCSNTLNYKVNVYDFPIVANIVGKDSLCVGAQLTLNNATIGGVWSSDNSGIASVVNGVVEGKSVGKVKINYAVTTNGCSITKSTDVNVNSYPVVSPINGGTDVCVASSVQLSNTTPSGTWSSSNPTVASINAIGLVTGKAPGITLINYTLKNLNCSSTVTADITVKEAIGVSTIIGNTDICIGATSQLTNATVGGTWSSSNTSVATVNPSTGLVTSTSTGNTIIKYDVITNGVCPQSTFVTFNVRPINTVTGQVTTSLCVNSALTPITHTTTGATGIGAATGLPLGVTASWSSNTITISGTPTQPGVFNYNIPLTGGCGNVNATGTITVNENKKLNLKQVAASINSIDFSWDNLNEISYNYSYYLNGSGSATGSGVLSPGTTSYSVKNLNAGDSIIFTLQPIGANSMCINQESIKGLTIKCINPSVKLYQLDTTLCAGAKLSFRVEAPNLNQALNYTWFINNNQVNNNDNVFTTSQIQNFDKVSVKILGNAVCANNTEIFAKMNVLDLHILTPDMVMANVDTLILKGSPDGGVFSGEGIVNNKLPIKNAGLGIKKIKYTYDNSYNNCKGQLIKNVMIYDTVFKCTATIFDTLKVMKYDTVKVTNNVTKYDTIKVTNIVTKYDTITVTNNVTKYDTVLVKKNVYDTITVTNNVTKYDTVTIKKNVYDTITVTNNVTKYDTVLVKKNVYDTITVTKNVTKYDTIFVKKNVYDTITITKNVTKYDTVTVKKNVYDTVTITNNVTKYDTVIVKKNVYDTIIIKNTIYDTVKYTVTDTISILKLKFKLTTGVKAKQETSMRVFPNPTSDILFIEAADEKALAGYKYKIIDAAGKEVYFKPVVAMITEISLKSFGAAGTYFFELFDEKQQRVVSKKIILE